MLPPRHRLTREREIKKVIASGRFFNSPSFNFKFLPNKLLIIRVAIVVSTKVSKLATKRNRLRRQVREIFRLNLAKIKPGYDLVVFLRSAALNKGYNELNREILANLSKIKLC